VASFLASSPAPAVLGRGGATFAFGADLQSAASNPAALAGLGSGHFSFSHAELDGGVTQEWAAWGGRIRGGPLRIGLGGVLRNEGTLEGRDAYDQPTSETSARSWAFAAQLARPIGDRLVLGGAARWVGQRIGTDGGDGVAFDAGAQWRAGPVSLGLAAQNFGGGMNWGGQRWRMPASLGGGVAFDHAASGLRLAVDLAAPSDYYRSARAGAEWRWRERLALRAGYRRELGAPADDRLNGPAFGFGAGAGAFWIDYGYVIAPEGGTTHRFGLSLRRPGAGVPPAAETPARPASTAPSR
jgi:hypothetical protein